MTTMKLNEAILDGITKDGSVDIEAWPDLLNRLIIRLDTIAHESFPAPTAAELVPPPPIKPSEAESDTQPDRLHLPLSQDCIAEPSSQATQPDVPPTPPRAPGPEALPRIHPHDAATLAALAHTLTTTFSAAPPHTVQRLSELLLAPNTHYKSLPKFLRALTRVLSVSSGTTAFPLADHPVVLQNGFGLGSDESLGGALLTPVPWLSGGSDGHALSPEAATREVPPLHAEDVGPQPQGTVFPQPPRSLAEVQKEQEEGREEEMANAPVVGEKSVEIAKKDDGKKENMVDELKEEK